MLNIVFSKFGNHIQTDGNRTPYTNQQKDAIVDAIIMKKGMQVASFVRNTSLIHVRGEIVNKIAVIVFKNPRMLAQ